MEGGNCHVKVKRIYLGIVAPERNICEVTRQLVATGLYFLLKEKQKKTPKLLRNCAHSHADLGGCVLSTLGSCSLSLAANLQTCLCSGTGWNWGWGHSPSKRNPGTSADTENLWRRMRKASVRRALPLAALSQSLGSCCSSITHTHMCVEPPILETIHISHSE